MPATLVVLITRIALGIISSETSSDMVLMSVLHSTDCTMPFASQIYFIIAISEQKTIARLSIDDMPSDSAIISFEL